MEAVLLMMMRQYAGCLQRQNGIWVCLMYGAAPVLQRPLIVPGL